MRSEKEVASSFLNSKLVPETEKKKKNGEEKKTRKDNLRITSSVLKSSKEEFKS